MNIYLQIFLYFDAIMVGVIATIAIHHAYYHFRPPKKEAEKPLPLPSFQELTPALKQHLRETAKEHFEEVIENSTAKMQKDLADTEERLTKQLEKLGTMLVDKEMGRYRSELSKLHDATKTTAHAADKDLAEHQIALKNKYYDELTAEKQHIMQQIDTKLADAVASFLMETLQHNIDLGAQNDYLISMLEEHKDDFKREVDTVETPTAK